jgi:predicted phosphohydrolase
MDRFGWIGHPAPLQREWDKTVRADDVVIVAGDISWATKPAEVQDDLRWLDQRPGQKVLLRGNHDYWWGDSTAKLQRLFEPFKTFRGFIHNSAVQLEGLIIAGSRLWTAPEAPPLPGGEMGAEEVRTDYVEREARRLQLSMEKAQAEEQTTTRPLTRVVAVHFPPLYSNLKPTAFSRIIEAFRPKVCVYGHLHGDGIPAGFVGDHGGVRYVLAACDAAGFRPVLLLEM